MLLHLSDISSEPLHGQISRQIRAKILSGDIVEGHPLPSIRAMAREQHVSVITVQRAYEDLDREGLIHSRRGKGFYVSAITENKKSRLAVERLRENLEPVVRIALSEGVEPRVIGSEVRNFLKNLGGAK
jgi:GntR family transcriptional regulator